LCATSLQKRYVASRYARWIASSRQPREKCGRALSEDFGSKKTFVWLVPRSIAGQPTSVKRIGFDCGNHSVGVVLSTPPGRS
jgi:hypothetical protein